MKNDTATLQKSAFEKFQIVPKAQKVLKDLLEILKRKCAIIIQSTFIAGKKGMQEEQCHFYKKKAQHGGMYTAERFTRLATYMVYIRVTAPRP